MPASSEPQFTSQQFGELDCTLFGPAPGQGKPQFCVILSHGFGAPGTDLVPLGPEVAALCKDVGPVLYIFPQAPLDLGPMGMPGGRAWWMVDIERYQRAMSRPDELLRLAKQKPNGMSEASAMMQGLLDDVRQQTGIPIDKTLIGGFSQGSMISTDVSLRLPEPPAGLCVFSGAVVAEDEWRSLAKNRQSLPVLQSHGTFDPILPYRAGERLRDLLTEAGLTVDFLSFDGPHTIPFNGIERLALLIRRLAAR